MSTLVVIDINDKKGARPLRERLQGLPHVETFCPDLAEGHGGEACQLARKLDGSRGGYLELFRVWIIWGMSEVSHGGRRLDGA